MAIACLLIFDVKCGKRGIELYDFLDCVVEAQKKGL